MTRYERNVNQVNADFTAIKNKLIEAGVDVPAGTPTADYAEKVGTLYDRGKQAEYDAFWDAYQENGKKIGYAYAFGNSGWNNETLLPKYDIVGASNSYGIFYYSQYKGSLKELLDKQGITLSFPNAVNVSSMFSGSYFTEIGVVDFSSVAQAAPGYIFSQCIYLHTVEKVILSNVVDMSFLNWFYNTKALENITFEGVIANDIEFKYCTKLTRASIENIINHLSDETTDKTLTLSKTAVNSAFETSEGASDGEASTEWGLLEETKFNWTITLA